MGVNEGTEMTGSAIYTHDEKGQRTDIHRPSAINPGDYKYLRVDEARSARKDGQALGGPGGTCHHCGKAIVWRVHYQHVPSGNVMTFGYICAGILDMTDNRIDHEMTLLKRKAANERKEAQWETQKRDRFDAFVEKYPDEWQFIVEHADENDYIGRIKWGIDKYGSPLDYMIPGLQRFIAGHHKLIATKLKEAAEQVNMPELEAGRRVLTGTIIAHKWSDDIGYGSQHKMTVKLDDGNKVFGTMPQSIEDGYEDDPVGLRVEFTAKVEPKDDHFGFFNRPTKGTVL
jgi:hypothetical protein